MTLTAGPILEAARDRHVSFDRRHHPDPTLLRYLSSYVRTLHGTVAAIDETLLAVEEVVALPLFDFDAGIPIPANRTVVSATLKSTGTPARFSEITLITAAQRFDPHHPRLAAWEVGGVLTLRGKASDYTQSAEVGLSLVPVPADLTSLTSEIELPDTAQQCLQAKVAEFMAKRGHTDAALPAPNANSFAADAAEAEVRFLADIANRVAGRSFRVRDTFSQR